jgi:hypothetical protein
LTHVTVVPTATVSGFGEYAVVVRVRAPLTIVTLAVAPVGAMGGVGAGAGDGLLWHAARDSPASRMTANLMDMQVDDAKTLPSRVSESSSRGPRSYR